MTKCKILLISKINQAIMTWIKILYKPKRNIADGWEEPNYHDLSGYLYKASWFWYRYIKYTIDLSIKVLFWCIKL